jgi:hypothetical protein
MGIPLFIACVCGVSIIPPFLVLGSWLGFDAYHGLHVPSFKV